MDRRNLIAGLLAAPVVAGASGAAAAPDGATDSLQAASRALRSGEVLDLPAAPYALAGEGLVQTSEHSWRLAPGTIVRADRGPGDRHSLLTIRIAGQAEFRGGFLTGGRWLTWNPAAPFAQGGYAVEIAADGGGANVVNFRIGQASLAGGLGAVRWSGVDAGRTVAWSGIERSTLINGVVCHLTADGMLFRDNICDGIATAYRLDLIEGAFCCTIEGGSTGNREGAVDIVNGSLWRIVNGQMEHGVAYAGPAPADFTVIVRGTRYRSYLGIIEKSNFGAGVGRVRDTIVLQNAAGTVIDANYFFLSDRADIRIESDAAHTIVGARNMAHGTRPLRPTGRYTDLSRRLAIDLPADTKGARAIGTRGVWHPAADILTDFTGGWQPRGLEVLLTEAGLVAFNGGMAGGMRSGRICTFPLWLRPHQDAWLHATIVADGTVRGLRLSAASGELAIVGSLPGTELNLSNATYAAVLVSPYSIGP